MRPKTVDEILTSARVFKDNLKRPADYYDYEEFKRQLHQYNHYGYEGKLAEILGI